MLVPSFEGYALYKDKLMRYDNHIYISPDEKLRNLILREAHRAICMAHTRVMKMRAGLKPLFFWKG